MRRAVRDGLQAGGEGAFRAGEGAVADLQLDHVLAGALEAFGDCKDVKAVSAVRPRAKVEKVRGEVMGVPNSCQLPVVSAIFC